MSVLFHADWLRHIKDINLFAAFDLFSEVGTGSGRNVFPTLSSFSCQVGRFDDTDTNAQCFKSGKYQK